MAKSFRGVVGQDIVPLKLTGQPLFKLAVNGGPRRNKPDGQSLFHGIRNDHLQDGGGLAHSCASLNEGGSAWSERREFGAEEILDRAGGREVCYLGRCDEV